MNKNFCRRLCCLLACMMLLGSLSAHALEAHPGEDFHKTLEKAYEDLELAEGLSLRVDLSSFDLTREELTGLMQYKGLKDAPTRPWYYDRYTYSYLEDTGVVQSITLYRKDPEIYDYRLYEQRMAEILAATVYEGMSQWQMALSIYDYLAVHCIYDESETYRSAYDAVVRGTCVCSGYAEAYMHLLQCVGIESIYVASLDMEHAWNIMKVDGKWYHTDVTWGDPIEDCYGRVSHKYFLLSDTAMGDEEHGHYNWDTDIPCTDTALDTGRFWHGIDSTVCYESAQVCYYRKYNGDQTHTIYCRNWDGTETEVITVDTGYADLGADTGSRYFYDTLGLTLQDGRLYFADMVKVYSVKTDGTDLQVHYSHDTAGNKNCIRGSYIADGKLYLTLIDLESQYTTITLSIAPPEHTHGYVSRTVDPTCQERGYTEHICQCGVYYWTDPVERTEHRYGEGAVVKEPTLFEKGLKEFACLDCGHIDTREVSALTGDNNPLTDADGVDEDEYIIRRILLGAGIAVAVLLIIFRRKRR